MLYSLVRNLLFKFEPELVHYLGCNYLKFITRTPFKYLINLPNLVKPTHCMGMTFKNPIGVAAGLDKNGEYIDALAALGFGYIEIGTVTPQPQLGNQKPRLFRIYEAEGFINRMGFNNHGIDQLIKNINKIKFKGILGINISKNLSTPIERAKEDYLICMDKIYQYASYIAMNISSPNTLDLRTLQYGELFEDLLSSIKKKQEDLRNKYQKYVPIVIKISPDLSITELIKISDSLLRYNIDGVIATNTTIDRSLINNLKYSNEDGGLSGLPLHSRSTEMIRILAQELQERIPIIGVGGINCLISAREKLLAGAKLLQIYSGLIYKGPKLLKDIFKYL
ncbi:MAG: quinone-dependent dihydroorotate dehydrogenase [Candidatus Dasytiphilus stammeri]